jgi:hypothetical protein
MTSAPDIGTRRIATCRRAENQNKFSDQPQKPPCPPCDVPFPILANQHPFTRQRFEPFPDSAFQDNFDFGQADRGRAVIGALFRGRRVMRCAMSAGSSPDYLLVIHLI